MRRFCSSTRSSRRRAQIVAALLMAAMFWPTANASAQRRRRAPRADEAKFDQLLQDVDSDDDDVPVIVEFTNENGADAVIADNGGRGAKRLGSMRGRALRMNKRMLRRLAKTGTVKRVHLDRPVEAMLGRMSATSGALTVHQRLGFTGAGVGVAVIDSGVTPNHEDLRVAGTTTQRIKKFVDFVGTSTAAYDDWGHGTHVAGIIAGNGYDSNGTRTGMAPGANLIVLKALDRDGKGRISSIIAALDWVVANKALYNIRVVNMSLGAGVFESYNTDPLTLAAKRVVDAGVVVVAAAGNIGRDANGQAQYGAITAPGNAPWVLTVGAFDGKGNLNRADDDVAPFSSRGPTAVDFIAKPDLVAPGTSIASLSSPNSKMYVEKPTALLRGTRGASPYPYMTLSGTSMATPAVSGAVALMLQANPSLTPNLVKAILQFTAQDKENVDVLSQGAGFLDARGAVTLADYFRRAVPGSRYPLNSSWSRRIVWGNHLVTGGLITPNANAWKTTVVWGAPMASTGQNIVWGENCHGSCFGETWGSNIVWGENIVWGQNDNVVWGLANGANIVWGENIVWGNNVVWGENIVWGESEDNIVWGNDCGGLNCALTVWGANTGAQGLNIVWGNAEGLNVVWGNNVVWGENIVWGESTDPDASWGSSGTDEFNYGDETAEVTGFDPLVWDLVENPELVVLGGTQ